MKELLDVDFGGPLHSVVIVVRSTEAILLSRHRLDAAPDVVLVLRRGAGAHRGGAKLGSSFRHTGHPPSVVI